MKVWCVEKVFKGGLWGKLVLGNFRSCLRPFRGHHNSIRLLVMVVGEKVWGILVLIGLGRFLKERGGGGFGICCHRLAYPTLVGIDRILHRDLIIFVLFNVCFFSLALVVIICSC